MNYNHELGSKLPQNHMNLHLDSSPNDIWKLFYPDTQQPEPISDSRNYSNARECFLFNSIFINHISRSAIYYTNHNMFKFLYSDCLFSRCSSTTHAGVIFISGSGSAVQYRSCCYKSVMKDETKGDESGHHSYIKLESLNYKSYIFDCSFYECGNIQNSNTNCLLYGDIEVKSINTSFCKAKFSSGVFNSYKQNHCRILTSSFCNTTSSEAILKINILNFSFCNVLNNELQANSVVFFVTTSAFIENCSILFNNGTVFNSDSISIHVINTFCDNMETYKNIQTENVQKLYSINSLNHFASNICEAYNYQENRINKKETAPFIQYKFSIRR